ncbi:MAG: DotU family type IV/VI secretion system protein [Planctomycetales bacterium]|nr:DotU family type IV/VI secretion system protein [Planctomycetales bacterium]MCA9169090.1 DotU family type IV/VI secretion system protein [Planctomycetales bacterium]
MTPMFAEAIDPLILAVLDQLDRIGRNEALVPQNERSYLQNRFHEAEAKLGGKREWQFAKYALASWVDDMLIEAPWEGRDWWENNSLEFAYFQTRDRATQFFVRATQAMDLPNRDALEVFYLCVVLGFRGFYTLPDAVYLSDQLGLPPNLEGWTERVAKSIQVGQGRPRMSGNFRSSQGAPPLEGKFQLLSASLLAVILSAFTIVVGYFAWAAEFARP